MQSNFSSVVLCFVCGILDATCFVALGGTFVGLMTGNLILMGVSLGGNSSGVDSAVFLYPLGGYACAALCAGLLFRICDAAKAARLGLWTGCILLWIVTVVVWIKPVSDNTALGWFVVTMTAVYMGFQSAALYLSKYVAITTNVMTSTLTGFLADYPIQMRNGSVSWHKFFALSGFVAGVVLGGVLAAQHNIRISYAVAALLALFAIAGIVKQAASQNAR